MQATAAPSIFETTFGNTQEIWREEAPASQWKVIEPVIELAITQANAKGAYVYRFDDETARASLSAFVGREPFAGASPSTNRKACSRTITAGTNSSSSGFEASGKEPVERLPHLRAVLGTPASLATAR